MIKEVVISKDQSNFKFNIEIFLVILFRNFKQKKYKIQMRFTFNKLLLKQLTGAIKYEQLNDRKVFRAEYSKKGKPATSIQQLLKSSADMIIAGNSGK